MDPSQIEAMKQPFVQSLFNILDLCQQRQTAKEQSGKQTKMTSIWHPIIGHVRGKTNGMIVLVHFHKFSFFKVLKSFHFRSNQDIVQRVIMQYKYLWSKSFVNMLFESIPTTSLGNQSSIGRKETSKPGLLFMNIYLIFEDIIRAKFEKLFHSKTTVEKFLTDDLTQSICRITTFYQKLIETLTELRLQILCG
jgi:hypothetical protein